MNFTQKTINFFHPIIKKIQFKNSWHDFIYIQIAFWLKYAFQLSFFSTSYGLKFFCVYSQIVHHWMRERGIENISRHLFIALFFRNKKKWERSEEIIINKFLHLLYDSHTQTSLLYNVLCTASEWELYDRPLATKMLVTFAKFGVRKKRCSLRVWPDAWKWWKRQQIFSTHG